MSCSFATACIVASSYTLATGVSAPLAEQLSGASWSNLAIPAVTVSLETLLNAVSCTSTTACTAVGYYLTGGLGPGNSRLTAPFATRWDGSSWSMQLPPDPSDAWFTQLNSVSCTSANSCLAIGRFQSSTAAGPIAERWNGTTWSLQTLPDTADTLAGVSCTSASACTAVGSAQSSGDEVTVAERWNGTIWSAQSPANAAGTTFDGLAGVSCTQATVCIAVGFAQNDRTSRTLAEGWNGSTWAIDPSASPKYSILNGVSCATACTAVGTYDASSGSGLTLAERQTASGWSVQSTPHPAGGTASSLNSVSCPSSTGCTAVGSYTSAAGHSNTLAESWNGSAWSIQTTHNPGGAAGQQLNGVACVATSCEAVGSYTSTPAGVTLPLVERDP